MNKEEVLNQLQTEIDLAKKRIIELAEEGRPTDKVFYQGMLLAYEKMQSWVRK